jgi:hypothetical protein
MERIGEKKKWVAPELLVLVRRHPEEAILTTCKLAPSGPLAQDTTCDTTCGTGCEAYFES